MKIHVMSHLQSYWQKIIQSVYTKKNLQILATETFKSKNGMELEKMNDIFHFIKIHATFEMILYYKENEIKQNIMDLSLYRSSHSQMFFKIGVLKNFAIFTENTCENA